MERERFNSGTCYDAQKSKERVRGNGANDAKRH